MVQPHRQIQQHQRPLVVVVVLGKCSPPTAVHLFVVVVVAAVAAAAAAEIHSGCYFLYFSFFFSSGLDSRYNWWWWWSHSLSCQRSIHLLPLSCSLGFSSRSHTKPPIGKKETKAPLPSKVLGPNAATIKRSNNHQATNLSSSFGVSRSAPVSSQHAGSACDDTIESYLGTWQSQHKVNVDHTAI